MEQQGQSSASALSDYRDPWRHRLEAFGIQSVHGLEGSARPGAVYVMPDMFAAWVAMGGQPPIAEDCLNAPETADRDFAPGHEMKAIQARIRRHFTGSALALIQWIDWTHPGISS